ncbi:MAG: UDP-N-acetylmuramoyl-tripeptide--D-alanyl-D-alanine ligase [Bacteroidetes bacterium GWF2_33_16]|nr:MAG: UDP-N-acetylmuramoyl-tripeptide--D-alanyl-D-alanine ligase [Bacteroidetes bacterium GWE2_32_14]OFY07847.1 MAG: UDP-N-acetylmuramoyl-tripeptide--D-alanyl-D-alanine ligase [Bacteroidetes bacterium GWF2_33_16]
MQIEQLYDVFIKHPIISIDSRIISKDCLFFALKGDRFNGNQFAEKAIEIGAAYAIIDEIEYAKNSRFILVKNVLETLQELANYHRKKLKVPILAITGTNGKTTTKELVSSVLKQKYRLIYTQGNLNNHIGVPLTLLSMKDDTEFGVVEMGANHMNEIMQLCKIAEPDFGLITNIGKAHLEGFGSFENIIKTKSELYNYLNNSGGTIFYNAENSILSELVKSANTKIIPYGDNNNSSATGIITASNPFINAKITQGDNTNDISTKLIGNYNLENILAAVCVGTYFGVKNELIGKAIENYIPSNNRSQFIKSKLNNIFLDAYNANPTSIEASLLNFIEMKVENKCLILGDMLELGSEAVKEHERVLEIIKDSNFQKIILVGDVFSKINSPANYFKFINVNQTILWLEKNKIVNSNVLIKGSRGIQLERIVDYL